MSNITDDGELRKQVESANTIAELDKLRMDIVSSKNRDILKLWQEKYWERKKKYTFNELRQYGDTKALHATKHISEQILNVGHNLDCMFCGFKDKIAIGNIPISTGEIQNLSQPEKEKK